MKMMKSIAFLVDGNNLYTDHEDHGLHNILIAAEKKVKILGYIGERWMYFDGPSWLAEVWSGYLGHETKGYSGDVSIKKGIKKAIDDDTIDVIAIGSGDGHFAEFIEPIRAAGKDEVFVSWKYNVSSKIYLNDGRVIQLVEDDINEMVHSKAFNPLIPSDLFKDMKKDLTAP